MPAASKKRPPTAPEAGESKAEEANETPEEETREGAEPDNTPKSTNRKRSAKNAKNTKAPMDADCGCGCGGKKGASCDCGSGYAKKMDSLTPQEYLAACDLGIQGRSRAYIRARLDTAMNLTPSSIRADLKCGRGAISQGEKCHVGPASKAGNRVVNQAGVRSKDKYSFKKQQQAWGNRGAAAFGVGGALLGASHLLEKGGGVKGALAGAVLGGMAGVAAGKAAGYAEGTLRAAGNRTARAYSRSRANGRAAQAEIAKKNPKWEAEYRKAKAGGASTKELTELSIKQAGEVDKILNKHSTQIWTNKNRSWSSVDRAKRRDSVYAAGFTPELDQLAI